jgi:hypothetical protein
VAVVAVTGALLQPTTAGASQSPPPQVRVNQVGYPANGPKVAYAMLTAKVASVRFEVDTPYGMAYRGTSTDDLGAWNANYKAVYRLSFSGLNLPGQYQVKLLSPARAVSPGFIIGDGSQLYQQLVDNSVRYFTSERDGPDVDSSVMDRQPANLTDEKAYVYADPRYDSNDNLLGTLKKAGGPVDVSGGWFDAGGGYEKFGYTASYADALMLLAARDYPTPTTCSSRRPPSACSGSPSCGIPPARCSTPRSASAPATPATRSRATTTSGSCPSRRTG